MSDLSESTAPPSGIRCVECGVEIRPGKDGAPPIARVGRWALLRWCSLAMALATIAFSVHLDATIQTSVDDLPDPPDIVEPAISFDDVLSVAEGTASEATLTRWSDAMTNVVRRLERYAPRDRWVTAGFIEPPLERTERWILGWPGPWLVAERTMPSPFRFDSEPPDPGAPSLRYLPKLPDRLPSIDPSDPTPWTLRFIDIRGGQPIEQWSVSLSDVAWRQPGAQLSRFGIPTADPIRQSASLAIRNWSAPLLAAIALWVLIGRVDPRARRRWRVLAIAVVLAVVAILSTDRRFTTSTGWTSPVIPHTGWREALLLPSFTPRVGGRSHGPWLHGDQLRAAITDPEDRRAFAAHLLRAVSSHRSVVDVVLAVGGGPIGSRELWTWRTAGLQAALTRSTDLQWPAGLEQLDAASGPSIKFYPGVIWLAWRAARLGDPSYQLFLPLGPLGWCLLFLLAAWCVPPALVHRIRRRQAARRLHRQLCPACAHPLPRAFDASL